MDHMAMDHGNMGTTPGNMDGGMTMTHIMKSYFYASAEATILFEKWTSSTWQEMLGSCVAVLFVAICYELLKYGRRLMVARKLGRSDEPPVVPFSNGTYGTMETGTAVCGADVTVLQMEGDAPRKTKDKQSYWNGLVSGWVWLDAALYMVEIFVSYCLMLVVMTYNAYLVLAVIVGAGIGFLVLTPPRAFYAQYNEHCH